MICWVLVFIVWVVSMMFLLILCSVVFIRCVKNGVVFIISGGMVLVMFSEVLVISMVSGIIMISRMMNGNEWRMFIISESRV